MTGKPIHTAFAVLALSTVIALAAAAEEPKNDLYKGGFQYRDMGATPGKNNGLYQALGGKDKIRAFTTEFVGLIAKDDRIGHYFAHVDLDHLADMLTDQFVELGGGPVKYTGRDMRELHDPLGITTADFNRLAENLQVAMDHAGVPFATQNRLVALLASMQRAIVTK